MTKLYDGFHKIEEIRDDKGRIREKLILKSAVGAVVTNKEDKICLVKQYRPAVGHETWEIPAGVLDKGLSSFDTMIEELQEECNLDAQSIFLNKAPFSYYMVTGSSDAVMRIFSMKYTGESEDKLIQDDDVSEIKWFSKEQLKNMIIDYEIFDAKTIMALYRYKIID